MLDNRDRQMRSIIHQPRNIILGHFGKLFLENAFQPREDHKAVARPVVIDHPEFNISSTLLENRRLYKSDYQSHIPQDHLIGRGLLFQEREQFGGGASRARLPLSPRHHNTVRSRYPTHLQQPTNRHTHTFGSPGESVRAFLLCCCESREVISSEAFRFVSGSGISKSACRILPDLAKPAVTHFPPPWLPFSCAVALSSVFCSLRPNRSLRLYVRDRPGGGETLGPAAFGPDHSGELHQSIHLLFWPQLKRCCSLL